MAGEVGAAWASSAGATSGTGAAGAAGTVSVAAGGAVLLAAGGVYAEMWRKQQVTAHLQAELAQVMAAEAGRVGVRHDALGQFVENS